MEGESAGGARPFGVHVDRDAGAPERADERDGQGPLGVEHCYRLAGRHGGHSCTSPTEGSGELVGSRQAGAAGSARPAHRSAAAVAGRPPAVDVGAVHRPRWTARAQRRRSRRPRRAIRLAAARGRCRRHRSQRQPMRWHRRNGPAGSTSSTRTRRTRCRRCCDDSTAAGIGAEVISPYELWLALRLGVSGRTHHLQRPGEVVRVDVASRSSRDVLLHQRQLASATTRRSLVPLDRASRGRAPRDPDHPARRCGAVSSGSTPTRRVARRASAAPIDDPCVDLRGLHVHRGITIRDRATIAIGYLGSGARRAVDALRAPHGLAPRRILDLGGSLACPRSAPIPRRQFRLNRALGDRPAAARSGGARSRSATHRRRRDRVVAEHFPRRRCRPPRVVLEPGRALTGDTQMLLTTVRRREATTATGRTPCSTPASTSPNRVPHEFHQLFSVSARGAPATTSYRLVGPICTPADVLYNNWRLPPLEPGHVLAIMDTGAYFVPFSTSFSFPRPAIVLQDGDDGLRDPRARVVRRHGAARCHDPQRCHDRDDGDRTA